MEPLTEVLLVSVEACEVFYKMRYLLQVAAPLAACDDDPRLLPSWNAISGFYPNLRNERGRRVSSKKPTRKIVRFDAGYVPASAYAHVNFSFH